MGYCYQCGQKRGYIFKAEDGKLCRACYRPTRVAILKKNIQKGIEASAKVRKGKPSPLRGIKTGRTPWNKKNIDPLHKILRDRVSRRMRQSLSGRNLSKNWAHIFDMLGYTVDDLKRHLESKFQPGMTWDNIGQWHIDHIRPDSWFNYSSIDDEEFKKCWALDNLQPLWAKENISKGNKYEGAYKKIG